MKIWILKQDKLFSLVTVYCLSILSFPSHFISVSSSTNLSSTQSAMGRMVSEVFEGKYFLFLSSDSQQHLNLRCSRLQCRSLLYLQGRMKLVLFNLRLVLPKLMTATATSSRRTRTLLKRTKLGKFKLTVLTTDWCNKAARRMESPPSLSSWYILILANSMIWRFEYWKKKINLQPNQSCPQMISDHSRLYLFSSCFH